MNEELHGNPHYTLGRFLGLASSVRSGSSVGFILKEILVIEKEYLESKERNKAAYWQDIPCVAGPKNGCCRDGSPDSRKERSDL